MKFKTTETFLVKRADGFTIAALDITKWVFGVVRVRVHEKGKFTYSNWALFGDLINASAGAKIDHIELFPRFYTDWITDDCLGLLAEAHHEYGEHCKEFHEAKSYLAETHGVSFACEDEFSFPEYCWYVPGLGRLLTMGYTFTKI